MRYSMCAAQRRKGRTVAKPLFFADLQDLQKLNDRGACPTAVSPTAEMMDQKARQRVPRAPKQPSLAEPTTPTMMGTKQSQLQHTSAVGFAIPPQWAAVQLPMPSFCAWCGNPANYGCQCYGVSMVGVY